jgi:cytochrome c oxidase subunit 2
MTILFHESRPQSARAFPAELEAMLLPAAAFPLHPVDASTIARDVDHLFFFLTAVTLFFTCLIFGLIFYFMLRYRRRSESEIPPAMETSSALEITWTVVPTAICAVLFFWSSSLYFRNSRPPLASQEIFVVGKQWMWKLQHPEGPQEINQLHVPVGVPVKLTMTSEDVIHDFYIPAFRIKKDVLPGRYASIWFEATETGTYHFYCAQYCGAQHAAMIGWVYVMSPADYAQWLSGGVKNESMSEAGETVFTQLGCVTCHVATGSGRCPTLVGLFGRTVKLRDGRTVTADESYLRNAIVNPNSMPLPGYETIMPSFQGQIGEEQLLDLIAYIKSLGTDARKQPTS